MAGTAQRPVHGPDRTPDEGDDDRLIDRFITEDPHGRGFHRAYVVVDDQTWVPVWVLAGYLRYGGTAAQAATDYALPREAVEAGFAYYRRHRDVLDSWLTLNDQRAVPGP